MKKVIIVCLMAMLSATSMFAANEYHVGLGYTNEAKLIKSDDTKLDGAFNIYGDYLFDVNYSNNFFTAVKVGPYVKYQFASKMVEEQDGASFEFKNSFTNLGVAAKVDVHEKVYLISRLGLNLIQSDFNLSLPRTGEAFSDQMVAEFDSDQMFEQLETGFNNSIKVDTKMGVSIALGAAYKINDQFDVSLLYEHRTGERSVEMLTNSESETESETEVEIGSIIGTKDIKYSTISVAATYKF